MEPTLICLSNLSPETQYDTTDLTQSFKTVIADNTRSAGRLALDASSEHYHAVIMGGPWRMYGYLRSLYQLRHTKTTRVLCMDTQTQNSAAFKAKCGLLRTIRSALSVARIYPKP